MKYVYLFFSTVFFSYSILMFKLKFINQIACLEIDIWNVFMYFYIFFEVRGCQILF